jgi:hypothetical protein
MINTKLIEKAINIASGYLEAERIYETNNTLRKRATIWYENTDIADARTLAAVVISGDFKAGITWNEILKIEDFFFPQVPLEYTNYSIGEIEEAQHDAVWQYD